jgi:hypothetical protein
MVDDAVCGIIDKITLKDMAEWEGSSKVLMSDSL